jgi:hypothetical protein
MVACRRAGRSYVAHRIVTFPGPQLVTVLTDSYFKAHFAWRPPVTRTSLVEQKPPV